MAVSPAEYWAQVAEPYRADYGNSIVDLAIDRLAHGDVTNTAYGIRVALRGDLGDDRSASGSQAYWPDRPGGCRCRSFTSRGDCSHSMAADIFRDDLEPGSAPA